MAKVGEGDERWIVSDRADGTNVNQWHWQERDCLEWCKDTLARSFDGKEVAVDEAKARVVFAAAEVTGEAYINTRKGKLIAGFELKVEIPFEATAGEGERASGKVVFPYVGDENQDDDEQEMSVAMKDASPLGDAVKQALVSRSSAHRQWVSGEMNAFVAKLSKGGPALEKGSGNDGQKAPATKASAAEAMAEKKAPAPAKPAEAKPQKAKKSSGGSGASGSGKSIELREEFYCRPCDMFECLMDEGRVRAYTGSHCSIVREAGAPFSLFNGSVTGTLVEIVTNERVVQMWRNSSWPEGTLSRVEITITSPSEGKTVVTLKQSGIPEEDDYGNSNTVDVTYQGWRGQIFGRIRQCFGFGC